VAALPNETSSARWTSRPGCRIAFRCFVSAAQAIGEPLWPADKRLRSRLLLLCPCPIKADHVSYWDVYIFLSACAIGDGSGCPSDGLEPTAAMVALGSPTALAGKLRSVLQNVESKWNVLLDSLNLKVFKSAAPNKSGIRCCLPCALRGHTRSRDSAVGRSGRVCGPQHSIHRAPPHRFTLLNRIGPRVSTHS
jgi:hypothetical protein